MYLLRWIPCVDSDGNAIENCTCFVVPDLPDLENLFAFGTNGDCDFSFANTRPRLGVTVSTGQDDALDAQGALVTDVMDGRSRRRRRDP
jgi:hypothetical protein